MVAGPVPRPATVLRWRGLPARCSSAVRHWRPGSSRKPPSRLISADRGNNYIVSGAPPGRMPRVNTDDCRLQRKVRAATESRLKCVAQCASAGWSPISVGAGDSHPRIPSGSLNLNGTSMEGENDSRGGRKGRVSRYRSIDMVEAGSRSASRAFIRPSGFRQKRC